MISFDSPDITPIGAAGMTPQLQVNWSVRSSGAYPVYSLEVAGPRSTLLSLAETAEASPLAVPAELSGVSFGDEKIVLADCQVRGEPGAIATLSIVYRRRNDRETDAAVAAGLRSRFISAHWIERQEMIEHYAARLARQNGQSFNAELFALWIEEADPEAKRGYKVTIDGEQIELDPYTKAVAQRYAMGIQYAGMRMMQVDVAETWVDAPPIESSNANQVMSGGIPENHRPLFSVTGNNNVAMTWMKLSDAVNHGESGFSRSVSYLGVPQTMMPSPVPDMWGNTPIDSLLHPVSK